MRDRPTRIRKARRLLEAGIPGPGGVWADLGCGDGIFTAALCSLVGLEGEIYAVDKDRRALRELEGHMRTRFPEAKLHTIQADFTKPLDMLPQLDGVVMANSLHFMRHKEKVLSQIVGLLKPGGRFILVEYNTRRGSFIVPHPLDEEEFLELAEGAGLRDVHIIAKIPSTYLGELYAGMGVVG